METTKRPKRGERYFCKRLPCRDHGMDVACAAPAVVEVTLINTTKGKVSYRQVFYRGTSPNALGGGGTVDFDRFFEMVTRQLTSPTEEAHALPVRELSETPTEER
jgi:hypothetical protein